MNALDEVPPAELLQLAKELGLPVGLGSPAEVQRAFRAAAFEGP